VATILATDANFRGQVRSALTLWLPLIKTLVSPTAGGESVVAQKHVDAAEAVLAELQLKSSPALRADLDKASTILEVARQYVGADIRDFWHAIQGLKR
jgi:hypothetical protein